MNSIAELRRLVERLDDKAYEAGSLSASGMLPRAAVRAESERQDLRTIISELLGEIIEETAPERTQEHE
jgi:uncharacterized Zn finger protein